MEQIIQTGTTDMVATEPKGMPSKYQAAWRSSRTLSTEINTVRFE